MLQSSKLCTQAAVLTLRVRGSVQQRSLVAVWWKNGRPAAPAECTPSITWLTRFVVHRGVPALRSRYPGQVGNSFRLGLRFFCGALNQPAAQQKARGSRHLLLSLGRNCRHSRYSRFRLTRRSRQSPLPSLPRSRDPCQWPVAPP